MSKKKKRQDIVDTGRGQSHHRSCCTSITTAVVAALLMYPGYSESDFLNNMRCRHQMICKDENVNRGSGVTLVFASAPWFP